MTTLAAARVITPDRVLEPGVVEIDRGRIVTVAPTSGPVPPRTLAPGFVDLHIHFPQIDVIGSPAVGLLPWLNNYTFPQESRFSDEAHCSELATFFLDELLRHEERVFPVPNIDVHFLVVRNRVFRFGRRLGLGSEEDAPGLV